jgi:hypothetical protein
MEGSRRDFVARPIAFPIACLVTRLIDQLRAQPTVVKKEEEMQGKEETGYPIHDNDEMSFSKVRTDRLLG